MRNLMESNPGVMFQKVFNMKELFYCCLLLFLAKPLACRILVPRPGIEPVPPAVEDQTLQ